ncbi:MAG: hypothetical protein AAGC57_14835 [Pseudomonadota bacterium]
MREVKIVTVSCNDLHDDVNHIIHKELMTLYKGVLGFSHRTANYRDKVAQNLGSQDDPDLCEVLIIEPGTRLNRKTPASSNALADAIDCLTEIDEDNGWVRPILIADTLDELSRPRRYGLPVRVVERGQVEDYEPSLKNVEEQIRRVIRGKFGTMTNEQAKYTAGRADERVACIELTFVDNTPTYRVPFFTEMNKDVPQHKPLRCDPSKIQEILDSSADLDEIISKPNASTDDLVSRINDIGDLSLKLFEKGKFLRDYGEALTRCEEM